MGTRFHNAYVELKDALFDVAHDERVPDVLAIAAEKVLVRLPMTRSERELYEHIFGNDGNLTALDGRIG